jgi:hypothetical protein
MQKTLSHVSVDYNGCPELKELDFIRLQALKGILAPFWTLTNQLSDRNASISSVLPAYFSLKSHLNNTANALHETILIGLENRMGPFLKKEYDNFIYKIKLEI